MNAYETYSSFPDDSQQQESYFDACVELMDKEIREKIHNYATNLDELLKYYCIEHKRKFKEEFLVN